MTTTLKIAAAVHLTEAHCGRVAATIARNITACTTCVTVPRVTRPKVSKTCYKASEGFPASAASGVQQGCVRAVITPGYFDVVASDKPECR